MSPSKRLAVIATIVLSCTAADQATKVLAARQLAGEPAIVLLGDTLRLLYIENKGAFLGLGSALPALVQVWLFVFVVGIFVVVVLIYAARGRDVGTAEVIALALVAAGGLGNLIDRVTLGAVRDFLNVGVGPLRTGIFNVADVALTAGAIVFLWQGLRGRKRREPDA